MADPFNTQPQRNYLDDILDQAYNDLEIERQRQDNIINAPDPAQRLGEIQKIEKQTENEAPEVQEAVRQSAYTNTSYYTGKPLNKPPSIEKQENKEKSFEETIQKYQQYEQLFQPYLQEEYNKIAQDIGQPKTSEDRSVIRGPFDRKPVYSEQDLETKAISQTKKRLSDEGILEPKRTFLGTLKETFTDYKKFSSKLPYLGGGVEAYEALDLLQSIKDIQRNTADQQDYAIVMNAQLEMQRDSDFGAMVMDIMIQLPAYAFEFATTAGTYTAGRKAGQKALQESVNWVLSKQGKKIIKEGADRFGLKAVKGVVGATTGTLARTINPKMFSRVVSNASNELLPDYELNRALDGKLEVLSSNEKSLGKSIVDGYLLTYLELLGEQSGESIPFLGKEFKTFLKSNPESAVHGLLKGLIRKNPNVPPGKFMQAVRQAGIQSVPVELMEERFTDFLQSGVEGHEFKMPTAEEWLAEAFAIGGFSVGVRGTGKALDKRSKKKLDKSKAKGLEAIKSGQLRQLTDDDITNFARSLTKEEAMELGISQETGEIEGQSDLGKEMIRRNLEMDKFPETETEFREAGARANIKQQQMEGKDFVGKLIEKAQSESGIVIEREYMDRTLADEIADEKLSEERAKEILREHGIDENSDPKKIMITGRTSGFVVRLSTAGTEERMAEEFVAVSEEMAEVYYNAEIENMGEQEFENEIENDRKNYYESTGEQNTGESNKEWFSTMALRFSTQGKVHESIGAKLTEIFKDLMERAQILLQDAFRLQKHIKEGKVSDSLLKKLEEATDFKKVGEKVKQAQLSKPKASPDGSLSYRITEVGEVNPSGVFLIGADMVARDLDGKLDPFGLRYTENYNGFALSKAGATKLVKAGKQGFNTVAVVAYDNIQGSQAVNPSFKNRVKEELAKEVGKRRLNKLLKENDNNERTVAGIVNKEIQEYNQGKPKAKKKAKINMNEIALNNAEPDAPQLRRKVIYVGTLKEIRTGKDRFREHDVYPAEQIFENLVELKEPIPIDNLIQELPESDQRRKNWGMMITQTNFLMTAGESNIAKELIKTAQNGTDVFTGTSNPDFQFFSRETEDTTPEQAVERAEGERQFKARQFASQIDEELGLGTATRSTVGFTEKYGDESALVSRFFGKQDQELLNYRGALIGLVFDQKDVTNFIGSEDGPHSLLKITIDQTDLIDLKQVMQNNGIPNKTIRIRGNQQDILLWDMGDLNNNLTNAIADKYNAKEYTKQKGEFQFLTNESDRKEARKRFIGIIQDYQSKTNSGLPKAVSKFLPDFYKRKADRDRLLKQLKAKPKPSYRLAPTFYSTAERVVTEKFPPTMKSQSVENFLKKNQVKPEEIQWLDLESLLKSKQKVTKEELQEWIQANKIEIKDVMLGESYTLDSEQSLTKDEFLKMFVDWEGENTLDDGETLEFVEDGTFSDFHYLKEDNREYVVYKDSDIEKYTLRKMEVDEYSKSAFLGAIVDNTDTFNEIKQIIGSLSSDATKHSPYQLPGEKEDYRELLLTLPTTEKLEPLSGYVVFKKEDDVDDFLDSASIITWLDRPMGVSREGMENLGYERTDEDNGRRVVFDNIPATRADKFVDLLKKYEYEWYNTNEDTRKELGKDAFKTSHYDEPNILAHVRFNTRKSMAGEQVLFIEELQSDWHTKGREKGYKGKPYVRKYNDDEAFKIYSNVAKELREILEKDKVSDIVKEIIGRRLQNVKNSNDMHIDYILTQLRVSIGMFENQKISSESRDRISVLSNQLEKLEKDVGNELVESRKSQMVPDAPFKGNGWIELIMKRMLRYASENNFDRIAWTTSNQQINRWKNEIRQNVDQISWQKLVAGKRELTPEEILKSAFTRNPDLMEDWEKLQTQNMGKQSVIVNGLKNNNNVFNQTIPIEGETTLNGQKVSLDGLLGKQMATQIRNSEKPTGIIEGDNLTIGGQGFKTVYDFAIKKILNKMGKKYSAKVDQVEIVQVDGMDIITQPSIPVTRKMKESALKGQPTFRASKMTSTDDVLSSPSFKKWFKGSQVKDKDGKPLVVYHGSDKVFDQFSGTQGNWFSESPEFSSNFAGDIGGNMHPVYLSLKNPLDFNKVFTDARQRLTKEEFEDGLRSVVGKDDNNLSIALSDAIQYSDKFEGEESIDGETVAYEFTDLFTNEQGVMRNWAKDLGYDGIVVPEDMDVEIVQTYAVFEPTQIKSIFNKGTFNPHDPRISFRMAPTNLVTPLAKIYQEQKGTKKSYTKKDFEIDLVRLGYPDETLKTAMDLFGIIRIKQIATDEPTPIEKELQKIQDLAVTRSNLKERIKRAYRLGAVEKEKEIAKLQKIVTNYARNNLPVGIYSKSEVTGLLAKVRDAKRARELATALERIDRIINTVNKRSALSKWNKTVKKKANVKKVKGVTEGTVGADVQEIVYTIRGKKKGTGYMDLTLAGVEQKIELLADIMEASEDGEPTDQQSLELNLLLTYGAIKEKSAEDIARATEQFDALVTAGRVQVIEDQEAYKARMKEIGNEILDVITGGAGPQSQASAQKLGLKKQGYIERIKKGLSKFDSQNQSLEYIFDKLSRLDKTSKPLESAINNYFMPMIRQARLSEYSGLVEMNTMLKENAERIFKVKDGKLTTRLNQNTIDTIIIKHNDGVKNDVKGPLIESELTYNQAYKKWMELMDPTLHPTFEKMGWDVNKTKRQIEDQLPKDMIKWAEWQLYEFYPMYYHRVNGTFRKRFRVNMAFNPMYSPISRRIGARADEGDDTLNKSKSPMGSMTSAGSLKSRVSNQEELTWVDGDTSIMKHITEMEHFIHYTDVMREMRSVFMNRNISKSIADFHGSGISQTLNKFMDDIARGGVDRSQNLEWMDKLRANFSRSVIGINPVVYAKQLASIPAYIADIPALDWATEFAKVFNPLEFKRMYRTLSKSKMVEMRYDQGFERDMVTALQNQKPGKLISGTDFVNTFAYAFTKMGDKQAIFLGGWAVYKYHYKKAIKDGKSIENAKQIAMKKFEEASLRSQQASNVEDLADFQRRGSLAKLFTMFMTSPNQYYRMVIGGYRNFFAGRGSKSENLRRIFVGQFLLPTLFQFISNGFKWDDRDQAVSILLFPFSGLLFFGKGVEHVIKSIYNLAYPMGPVSILDPFTDFGKSVQKTFNGKEFNAKKLFFIIDTFVSGFSKVFGVPYSGPKRAIENTIEVLTEETDLSLKDKTLKSLGFPMEKKKKKKRKKKPKIGNPVYLD